MVRFLFSGYPCPVGHVCPEGTGAAFETPCEKGYYNNFTGKGLLEDCIPCDPGMYCDSAGLETPTDQCAAGWYCARGAWSATPADYANETVSDTCFCGENRTGGKCMPGEFCPLGSSQPTPCTAGKIICLLNTQFLCITFSKLAHYILKYPLTHASAVSRTHIIGYFNM